MKVAVIPDADHGMQMGVDPRRLGSLISPMRNVMTPLGISRSCELATHGTGHHATELEQCE
jgi:hypothetical protein